MKLSLAVVKALGLYIKIIVVLRAIVSIMDQK